MDSLLLSPLHRIPTLWSLYRPLLRLSTQLRLEEIQGKPASSGSSLNLNLVLRADVKRRFRRSVRWRNLRKIQSGLKEGYEMLHTLQLASTGSIPHLSLLHSLSLYLSHFQPPSLPPPPRTTTKPLTILTPGIQFATPYSPLLPRLKPQPVQTSMMIFHRRKAIQRRWDRLKVVEERLEECREEVRNGFVGRGEEWGWEWREEKERIKKCATREMKRGMTIIHGDTSPLTLINKDSSRSYGKLLSVKAAQGNLWVARGLHHEEKRARNLLKGKT